MAELLKKSKENLSAALLLIENGKYAPSVHCSYYACFQRLKNLIANAYRYGYDDLKKEFETHNRNLRSEGKKVLAVHEFFINYKLIKLIERERFDHRIVSDLIDLKKNRTKSDYENVPIHPHESKEAYHSACKIIDKLESML